ncbi:hypothetical protein LXL04_020337 [Taraxacum kok-saghyz]
MTVVKTLRIRIEGVFRRDGGSEDSCGRLVLPEVVFAEMGGEDGLRIEWLRIVMVALHGCSVMEAGLRKDGGWRR